MLRGLVWLVVYTYLHRDEWESWSVLKRYPSRNPIFKLGTMHSTCIYMYYYIHLNAYNDQS